MATSHNRPRCSSILAGGVCRQIRVVSLVTPFPCQSSLFARYDKVQTHTVMSSDGDPQPSYVGHRGRSMLSGCLFFFVSFLLMSVFDRHINRFLCVASSRTGSSKLWRGPADRPRQVGCWHPKSCLGIPRRFTLPSRSRDRASFPP